MTIVRTYFYLLLFLLASCSRGPRLDKLDKYTCDERFVILEEVYNQERYTSLQEPLTKFTINCSINKNLELAHYYLADIYYKIQDWVSAEFEYRQFLAFFPVSFYQEETQYKLALVQKKQILSWDREQDAAKLAIESYQVFINDFPFSDSVEVSEKEIFRIKSQLAKKRYETARLYVKLGRYLAAALYFKELLVDYGDYVEDNDIYLYIMRCYTELKQINEVNSYFDLLDGDKLTNKEKRRLYKIQKKLAKVEKNLNEKQKDRVYRKKFENL